MFDKEALLNEVSFKAIKSSGSGGQHVNKVATKVELDFNVNESSILSEEQKQKLLQKLKKRLTKEGVLILQCGETRSQIKNKTLVINRFLELIKNALIIKKKRIPTKTPKSIIRKRLKEKQKQAEKKAHRRKPDID
ncbi:alternative ribosome rescue aminoacyl-tRNA hydrolase ArfB [Seonamhaeicola aphaedonensis]|uniref:Ribosome-associated protein n=1 Tax=Seonamhaeicola aphaedonensis TaxID=1461338 RepID=A0A3D9HMT9_9FLAO|nr:alternative ribosome rescue aminoacyl-tRNA hydrolase ArfB [Seonamhaeicola aphaedonensis]RED50631.1 ribosome-associated protein [Seonamhaeicola aphaedonensis]